MKIDLPEKVTKVIDVFRKNGGEIFVVGGAVRDIMLGRVVKDWDFTTNLTPEEMKKIFLRNSFYNNKFGTFSIVLKDKEIFEVTTYRTEQGYSDWRHPDGIKWGKTLDEDLMRRDFTINAMAVDINGNLTDIYGGQEDLKNKLIKTVGNPNERFKEDPLRMMRGIRIAAELGFLLENDTFESIQNNAQLIQNIAMERVREELFRILKTDKPGDGMKLLRNCGLMEQIMPEILAGVDMKQKGHHIYDVWNHSLEALNNCQSHDPITRLATFLHDVGKPVVASGEGENRTFHNHEVVGSRIAVTIGKRLRMSNKELEQLFKLVRWHMFNSDEIVGDKAVRRFIRNVTPEYLDEMIALRRGDRLGSGAKETSWRWEQFKKRLVEVQKQPFMVKDMKIDGLDVMKILKIKPSRRVGEVLEAIFAEVEEDPKLNDRKILLKKINNYK